MARKIEISFEKHSARAVAELADDAAPLTADAVWNALPLSGAAYHAKWANNEVYILTPPFAEQEPGKENATVFPIPGDILYLPVPKGTVVMPEMLEQCRRTGLIDLAIFYGRDNYLLGPDGHMPGNLFATITEGLEELAATCQDLWRNGAGDERMTFSRLEE
ncbi:MAG: DUF3830 family protein [Caldilineaceae bacterium]|nr:DUF3830 family protein [Caldilineaceae bacterium]MCY4091007.1 DUF3830 family protein [Caldilineaceae bacterium]MCY4116511.1 DUF3830 family protein [Caldilineaceae bacterium]MDE0069738.1 DUF3830 family protein [Caldilineaceae bacterium]MDE0181701.1 DUF3830 family protein [Caldilineaceae bacterium]